MKFQLTNFEPPLDDNELSELHFALRNASLLYFKRRKDEKLDDEEYASLDQSIDTVERLLKIPLPFGGKSAKLLIRHRPVLFKRWKGINEFVDRLLNFLYEDVQLRMDYRLWSEIQTDPRGLVNRISMSPNWARLYGHLTEVLGRHWLATVRPAEWVLPQPLALNPLAEFDVVSCMKGKQGLILSIAEIKSNIQSEIRRKSMNTSDRRVKEILSKIGKRNPMNVEEEIAKLVFADFFSKLEVFRRKEWSNVSAINVAYLSFRPLDKPQKRKYSGIFKDMAKKYELGSAEFVSLDDLQEGCEDVKKCISEIQTNDSLMSKIEGWSRSEQEMTLTR